jgi:hypothetical protein
MRSSLLTLTLTLLLTDCNYGTVQGIVTDKKTSNSIPYASVQIGEKYHTQANEKGHYHISHIKKGAYFINALFDQYHEQIQRIITIKDNDTLTLNFQIGEVELKWVKGVKSDSCPVCLQKDQLVPFNYGKPTLETLKKADRGELILGGCMVSSDFPRYRCLRDKVDF